MTSSAMRGSRDGGGRRFGVGLPGALVLALALLAGCGPAPAPGGDGEFTIVTSFYPMYIMAKNIAAGTGGSSAATAVRVINLTPAATGCLHDYQLTPDDMKTLATADVFVVNGGGMESFLDRALGSRPGLAVINASAGAELLRDAADRPNAHLWVSPAGARQQVAAIAAGLAAADPGRAAGYRAGAAAYDAKLAALQARMHAALDPLPRRTIVTMHEAFPYFAREFALVVAAAIEREPGMEPTAAELADAVGVIRRERVTALFAEPQYSARAAATLARETGATVHLLDPGVTGPDEPDAYLQAMERNLAVLVAALR